MIVGSGAAMLNPMYLVLPVVTECKKNSLLQLNLLQLLLLLLLQVRLIAMILVWSNSKFFEASCFFEWNSGRNSNWNLLRIPLPTACLTKFWSEYLKVNINKDKMQPFFVHFNIVRETDGSGNLKELNKNSKSIPSFSSKLWHFLYQLIQTTSFRNLKI